MPDIVRPVVCFGEVLWDVLPSGAEPGGAPMNVTYHLEKHQLNPALITRIGNDDAGRKIKQLYADRGILTDYFQTDEKYETGKVYAIPDENNDMTYDIVQPVAWDFISVDEKLPALVEQADYFVYGSLAARSNVSATSLSYLLQHAAIKVFDINLRAPHYSKESLLPLLQQADIVKLNEEELALTAGWFCSNTHKEDMIRAISEKFEISTVIVTLGAKGAILFMNNQFCMHDGYKVKVVDTIGSGDAFLAGFITQLIKKASPSNILTYACKLGAFIATKKGGCPEYTLQEIENFMPGIE